MKTIKPVNKQDVIKWLKRKKQTATFQFFNDREGCLFTRYLRHATGLKTIICCIDGDAKVEAGGREVRNVVPFHTDFWKNVGTWSSVDRNTAIKVLETI